VRNVQNVHNEYVGEKDCICESVCVCENYMKKRAHMLLLASFTRRLCSTPNNYFTTHVY